MTTSYKIAIIVGSLRRGSVNRKAALESARLAADGVAFDFVDIGNLPLYDEDLEPADAPRSGLNSENR
ncbi:NADPH-dependent FMN reductase [Tsuneonella aeria]|uniref:NADPH-dependent FMN reductase n=1 Tax=Tsuneonella aeria TaxID=1837929 RepID=UPI0023516C2C|nr:NAD(P)H-dependent oxidoreductase [Tsuneonella aeria]